MVKQQVDGTEHGQTRRETQNFFAFCLDKKKKARAVVVVFLYRYLPVRWIDWIGRWVDWIGRWVDEKRSRAGLSRQKLWQSTKLNFYLSVCYKGSLNGQRSGQFLVSLSSGSLDRATKIGFRVGQSLR